MNLFLPQAHVFRETKNCTVVVGPVFLDRYVKWICVIVLVRVGLSTVLVYSLLQKSVNLTLFKSAALVCVKMEVSALRVEAIQFAGE